MISKADLRLTIVIVLLYAMSCENYNVLQGSFCVSPSQWEMVLQFNAFIGSAQTHHDRCCFDGNETILNWQTEGCTYNMNKK